MVYGLWILLADYINDASVSLLPTGNCNRLQTKTMFLKNCSIEQF